MTRYPGNAIRGASRQASLGFLALLAAPVATAGEAVAPDDVVEQIVVVAHKDRRSVRGVAANVTTLSGDELRAELATSLDDVFRYVPGVDAEAAGTRFRTEGINIRGIGGNRVAILVDGVPLSDQFGIGSFSNATRDFVDAGLVQDIEVLHGPASALYGSAAIGGVVATRTPEPSDLAGPGRIAGNFAMSWHGADSSLQQQALLALGDRSLGLLLGASRRDGEQTESAAVDLALDERRFERRTGLAKLVLDDRHGHTWRTSFIHQASGVRSDLNALPGTGRFAATTTLAGDDRYRMDLASVAYEFDLARGPADDGVVRAFQSRADVRQLTLDERAGAAVPVAIERDFSYAQDTRGVDVNLWKDLAGARVSHRLGYGIELRDRRTEELRDGMQTVLATGDRTKRILGEVFPVRDFPLSRSVEAGAYMEDTLSAGPWTVVAGLRADRFELKPHPDDIYTGDNPATTPVSLDESDVSPKLGVIRRLSTHVDVYAQYAHGFRAPPYSDANIGLDIPMFNIRAVPNPELRSESSDGYEAGLRIVRPGLDLHVGLFRTRYTDFIETKVRVGVDPASGRLLFQSQNLNRATIRGAEAAMSWRFGGDRRAFTLDAAAYHAEGENDDSGAPINSVGPAQAAVGVSWRSPDARRQLRLKAVLTSRWDDRDESGGALFEPPGHAVVDFYYLHRAGDHATIRAGVHNVADRVYWRWSDVRGLGPGDPALPHLARAGRSFSVNVNVSW